MSDNLVIPAFVLPAVINAVIAFAAGRRWGAAAGKWLNHLAIGQGVVYLALSILLLPGNDSMFLLSNRYLFVDALSAYEALITSVVFLLAGIYARGYITTLLEAGEIEGSLIGVFYAAFGLLPMTLVMGLFSNNLALLWIFMELSTLFSVILLVTLKARENITAALKYMFITSTAMLFAFIGVIIVFALSRGIIEGGSLNWTELMSVAPLMPPGLFSLAFILVFIGFAAKSGIVPFHTWLPATYVRAPSVVSVMYGAVANLGLYAVLRIYTIGRAAGDEAFMQPILVFFGVAGILVGALAMITRNNTKKLIAFSSVEQSGLILLAFGLSSGAALFWALFHKFGSVLVKSLLFFSAGIFHRQYKSNKFFMIKDAFGLQPLAAWGLIVGAAAAVGVPMLPVFLAKFNILAVTAEWSVPVFILVLAGFLLAAAGFGYYLIRAFTNGIDGNEPVFAASASMKTAIVTTMVLLFAMGLFLPGWLETILNNITVDLGW